MRRAIAPDAALILEGIFLIRPELADSVDFVIYLDMPFAETFRRMAKPDGSDPDPYSVTSERYRAGQEIWISQEDPRARAEMVIDNSDFTNPKLVAMRGAGC